MSQTWTPGSRVSEGNRGQRNDERYDRRALRPGENSKGFITVAQPMERRPFLLGASWTFVTLEPGEVLWDTGAQEGLVGKQQLDKWCTLLAEHGLQVEWSQEKPESASGIGGVTQPIGVVYVPVGLAGYNGIIRCTVVEQDVPPLLPVVLMRTLQANLDLTDDGDKVIFRQFGAESSLRTLQSGHTDVRADQFFLMVGSSQKSQNCVRTTMKDAQQITCQSSLMCTRDPEAWTTIHQLETMTQQSARCCRPRQKTTSNGDGPTRSHPTNSPTSLPRFESGKKTNGPFQNHERDVRTSPRLRPSTDCDPEGRQ